MFYLRGALICFSVLVLVYAGTSLAVGRSWKLLARMSGGRPARAVANSLFALRMLPIVAAVLVVAILAVPSFLLLEPRGGEEAIGIIPALLSAGFVVLATVGVRRGWIAIRHTRNCLRRWVSRRADIESLGAVVTNQPDAPPVALAGVWKATLVISAAAKAALSTAELERAVAHEASHLRASDNLKKLLLCAFTFPGMSPLDRAWREAIEFSADAEAVHSQAEALDLASALVKIARLHAGNPLPELVSGLADGQRSTLEARIRRLLHWSAEMPSRRPRVQLQAVACALLLLVACNYPVLLQGLHVATELLVR